MKREIKIFISVVMLMLVGASAVFAATGEEAIKRPLRVYNEGFEEPVVTNNSKYDQLDMGKVPYWQSTAFEGKIELFIKNTGTYIKPNVTLVPRAGLQAAELNADEASTLYQHVYGAPGSVYEWGVSHRARNDVNSDGDKDTMAIFIGPWQENSPKKTAKTGQDQFMKTVDWLERNLRVNIADLIYGDCRAFEVFTTKFAADGKFEGETDSGYDNAISLTQTDTHTEKWHVWIVVSSTDGWYDYGVTAAEDCAKYEDGFDDKLVAHEVENSSYPDDKVQIKYKMPDYNYRYTVPATSTDGTIYAYCAYDTASTDTSKRLTIGNFVDYARLGILSPVRVTSTEGGSTDVTLNTMSAEVTSNNQFSTETAAGNEMSLVIKPSTVGEDTYTFIGAYINNVWKSSSDESTFIPNGDGTYTLSHTVEDGMNSIHIIFAKHPYIIHSPNGGTYKDTTKDTADKITEDVDKMTYNGAPTASGGARFTHWEIAGAGVDVGADHTVYIAEGSTAGKYNITVKDSAGKDVITINDTDIVVFIAHYEYPQTVNIYTKAGGTWNLSDAGGNVSIKYNDQITESSGATTTVYVEDNTTVSVTANAANAEYSLDRIVSNDTVTTENVFMFYSAGERVVSVYFMSSEVGAVVSYVDEFNETDHSYVYDTNTNVRKEVSNVGGVYGNTVSTAFTGFWDGADNTYTYVQWVINLPFDTDTVLKKNGIIGDFKDIQVEPNPYKTDTEAVNSKFRGGLYHCIDGNTGKQLIMNFPTVFTGAASIYSTIILDGIYSPKATAKLRSITEMNAAGGNQLNTDNGFSVGLGKSSSEMSYKSAENNYYVTEYSEEQGNEKN